MRTDPPTRAARLWFEARASVHRLTRAVDDWRDPPPLGASGSIPAEWSAIGVSVTPLFGTAAPSEAALEAGKVHNLRIAARRLDARRFEAGQVFSFWRHVGRPSRRAGFVRGREVREGCLVPSIAGGLCQLSNALYDAALDGGLAIVERHRHSVVVPGSLAERDRDATVFWSYVDLRFAAAHPFAIAARLTSDDLIVEILAPAAARSDSVLAVEGARSRPAPAGSCVDCARPCARYAPELARRAYGRTAFLLDRRTPEHDAWVESERRRGDVAFVPIDGRRFGRARYAWTLDGLDSVRQALVPTIVRAARSRRLADQGAARQRALLEEDARLARWMAARLGPEDTHLVVSQSLLPFLQRGGVLGGRTYDVLMTRLPLEALQARLDDAVRRAPESPTLGDFRAPAELVRLERDALSGARRLVTPHADIARACGERAVKLDWVLPSRARAARRGRAVVFLGPVVGRRGAHLMRDAMRDLDAPLAVWGRDLEGGFDWGRPTTRCDDPLADAAVIVAPAWVDHEPRALLEAVAAGVPVIASAACGLDGVPGVVTLRTGDPDALRAAIATPPEGVGSAFTAQIVTNAE